MTNLIDAAKSIAERSGNSFHSSVITHLQTSGWIVLVCPYFSDQATNKPREIDLIAEKAFPINGSFGRPSGTLHIQLFIECKFVKQPTVFWFHEQNLQGTERLLVDSTPLRPNNTYLRDHHYFASTNSRVAKLFAGQSQTSTEGEQIYKALNQSLNALVAYKNRGSILPEPSRGEYNVLQMVTYPVIVCGGYDNFFKIDIGSGNDPEAIRDNFILEVNYAYTNNQGRATTEFFLLDVVNFDNLDAYLASIAADVEAMSMFLSD